MCVSALLILAYHFWIPITSPGQIAHEIELFIRYVSFIGVDMFFFVSGFSVMSGDIKYGDFLKNRFKNIYFKFVVFALIAAIYKKWKITKFIKAILGIELFERGGGAFLWFVPAIMILYVFIPLYKKAESRYPLISLSLLSAIWLAFTIGVSYFSDYREIFIFTNRIPVFVLGYYFSKYEVIDKLKRKKSFYVTLSLVLVGVGNVISYKVFYDHVNIVYVKDVFYLTAIPLIVGVILLLEPVKSNVFTEKISRITLDLYGIQMVFGYKIATMLSKAIPNGLLCNFSIFSAITIVALMYSYIYQRVRDIV